MPVKKLDMYISILFLVVVSCLIGFNILANTLGIRAQKVPVLLYHHLADKSHGKLVISTEQFESQIKALRDAGYTSVSVEQIIDYVEKGTELPNKPVLITFDDGYLSNYTLAYPILKKYNMKATIFIIGVSVGKHTYKNSGRPIIPHFNYEQGLEMVNSGLIEIQSHTYDMHQRADYEAGHARIDLKPLNGESPEEYSNALKTDIDKSKSEIFLNVHKQVTAFSYPEGNYSNLSEPVLNQMGIRATFLSEEGTTVFIKGMPQTLRYIKRYTATGSISPEELIKIIEK